MENNKILITLLVIAIVISIVGLFMPKQTILWMTGKATDTGQLQVTISGTTAINFTDGTINWGTGTVTEGYSSCTLDTEGTNGADCTGFTTQTDGFRIENIGNSDVTLQIATGKNAATLLGGTSPSYQYKMVNVTGEEGACQGMAPTTYTDVNNTSPGTTVCTNFTAEDTADTVDVDVNIVIPSDSLTGTLTDTFTATATAI